MYIQVPYVPIYLTNPTLPYLPPTLLYPIYRRNRVKLPQGLLHTPPELA